VVFQGKQNVIKGANGMAGKIEDPLLVNVALGDKANG